MTKHLTTPTIDAIADVRDAPTHTAVDRSFGLPTMLYGLTVGAYLAFLAIMAIGMATRELIIPMGICVVYIAMAFGVPTLWTRMKPDHRSRPQTMGQFTLYGVETHTGRVTARDATVQVLILPVMVLLWGIAVVTISALV